MARPSKLTEKQWAEIERRLLAGEKQAALSKEFGIDRAAIARKFSQQVRNVNHVANQIVRAEESLKALPISQQIQAISLADDLRAISTHLGGAGKFGAMTAHRLSMIANTQTDLLDETAGLGENEAALKSVLAFSRTANDASTIGLNLLKANQAMINDLNNAEDKPEPKQIIFTVVDARA